MKLKIIYGILFIFIFITGYRVVSNMNKKRGDSKGASSHFIKNFNKIVGAKNMDRSAEANDDPDAEIKAMIDASGKVSDYQLQFGDERMNCLVDGEEINLKDLKIDFRRLNGKCKNEECSEDDKMALSEFKQAITQCISDNELGQE
jgi:hypothetical protein